MSTSPYLLDLIALFFRDRRGRLPLPRLALALISAAFAFGVCGEPAGAQSQCKKVSRQALVGDVESFEGIEAVNMMRKGRVKRLTGSDARGQAMFVASLFQIAA